MDPNHAHIVVQTSAPQVTSVTSVVPPPSYGTAQSSYSAHTVNLQAPTAYSQYDAPAMQHYTSHSLPVTMRNDGQNLGGGGKTGRAKKGDGPKNNTDMLRALNRILASQMKKLNEAPRADEKIIGKIRQNDPQFPSLADESFDMSPPPSDAEVANALNILKRKIAADGRGMGDRFDAVVVTHRGHDDEFDIKHVFKDPNVHEETVSNTLPNNGIGRANDYILDLWRTAFPIRSNPPRKRINRKPKPMQSQVVTASTDYVIPTHPY